MVFVVRKLTSIRSHDMPAFDAMSTFTYSTCLLSERISDMRSPLLMSPTQLRIKRIERGHVVEVHAEGVLFAESTAGP